MAWAKPTQITSWSYSRYSTYKTCPAKARYAYIDKLPVSGPKSPALVRGDEIHKGADGFLRGVTARLPADLKLIADQMKKIKAYAKKKPHLVSFEETLALRADWSTTVWNDWNGCKVRIKMDVGYLEEASKGGPPMAHIIDFKTGKFNENSAEDYMEQLDLYALGALIKWEQFEGLTVQPQLLYTDLGTSYPAEPRVYEAGELPALKKAWEKRVRPMLNDKKFAPKPNWSCRFCDYGVSKGGPCKYG